jgi:ATP/maltotriose-dependent transcriptional regulator MalT/DNA-binding SARP family transcriptional activator
LFQLSLRPSIKLAFSINSVRFEPSRESVVSVVTQNYKITISGCEIMATSSASSSFSMPSLLLTKITPPQPPRQLLRRERLLQILAHCRDYKLTLISAGAGYGKTTLLTDFAQYSDMALCWYSMDESDRDPAVFCRYLLQSVRQVYPSFGQPFENLLNSNMQELNQSQILLSLADAFIASFDNLKPSIGRGWEVLLVLDDFQFAESTTNNIFIKRFLDWLPQYVHVVIASRSLVQNLSITSMFAKQTAMTISQADLAFTDLEIKQLLAEIYPDAQAKAEEDRTIDLAAPLAALSNGWITAIILALHHNQLHGASANYNVGTQEEIFDYLAHEVLDRQTTEVQAFLFASSILEVFTTQDCLALLNHQVASSDTARTWGQNQLEIILQQIERQNLFIGRIAKKDGIGFYFQYHALFRQFLRLNLKQANLSRYHQLQLGAAELEKANSRYLEAVQHYVEADEPLLAATTLNEALEPLYELGQISQINKMVELIPISAQNQLPDLLNIKARLLMESGANEAALEAYRRTEQLYRQARLPDKAARAAANQAQRLLRMGEQKDRATAISQEILQNYEALQQTSEGQHALAIARTNLALLAIDNGDDTAAEGNLKEVASIYTTLGDKFRLAILDCIFADLAYRAGKLAKAGYYYRKFLDYFTSVNNQQRICLAKLSLGIVDYAQGNYQAAEAQLNETYEIMLLDKESNYLEPHILSNLANIYRDTERFVKADLTYTKTLTLAKQNQLHIIELFTVNEQATSFILQNRKVEATAQIQLCFTLAEEYKQSRFTGYAYYNQGWLAYSNRSFSRALDAFEHAISLFETAFTKQELTRAKLGQAVVLMALQEPKKAIQALQQSITIVTEIGFEPFLPYEMKAATALFEYAAHKKILETLSEFLRKHGFIAGLATVEVEEVSSPMLPSENSETENKNKPTVNTNTLTASLRVYGLNGGRVWLGNTEITRWGNSKAQEVLFYLLEHRITTTDILIEALWPDEMEVEKHTLNQVLFLLRRAIAPLHVKLNNGRYSLIGDIWYDVAEFEAEIKAATNISPLATVQLTKALSLYKQEFLAYSYSEWVIQRQRQLDQLYNDTLVKLAEHQQAVANYLEAIQAWQQLLRKDPHHEKAHHGLIQCFLATGNKVETLRQYQNYSQALQDYDLKPAPEITRLVNSL